VEYIDFLKNKIAISGNYGFDINEQEINPMLKQHQVDIVKWSINGGCRAIFASFGLGKSFMQLECCRIIGKRESGRQLIIAPLGVRQEFKIDAEKLGISISFIRRTEDLDGPGLYITNYESIRDGRLDPNSFNTISLDEASVLRSYGSKTFQTFIGLCKAVKYKFVATATPSPNRYKELIHYAGFLGIMDTGQALTRFFKRDSSKAGNLQIHPHMEKEFWLWVSSWAIFLQKPSDLGYSDDGYILPKLHVHYHEVSSADVDRIDKRDGQKLMFGDAAISLQAASLEKRGSIDNRINKMVEIIKESKDDHFIIWHDQEMERHAIKRAIPEAVEVFGSQDIDTREDRIIGFSNGEFKYLATKPILSGSGCNFQRHCNKAIFLGIGFKFNDFIQACHRIYRFMQEKECHIHIIYAASEIGILEVLKSKWRRHEFMVGKMTDIIKEYGLSNAQRISELRRTIGVNRLEISGKTFRVVNNDCVDESRRIEDNSVGLIHTSIPFANHYEYTPSYNDFGHTQNNEHFWNQMDYLTPELFRILKPGRIYACHVKDRILFGNVTGKGAPTVSPFHAECIFHSIKHGFDYQGMITVVTDVVRENNQTYRLGWSEQCKDGSKMGVGSPEYILIFRKPQSDRSKGYADEPIQKTKEEYSRARWQIDAHAFWRSSGDRMLCPDELSQMKTLDFVSAFKKSSAENIYDYDEHLHIGEQIDDRGKLPSTFMSIAPESLDPDVWTDVNRMLTLNNNQTQRCQNNHICPLQIDIVKRIINRYSNPGDVVFDPFGGIMTVPNIAIKMGRFGIASELNTEYFRDGVKYLEAFERGQKQQSLFDYIEEEGKK
jgi:DNA modification methylase